MNTRELYEVLGLAPFADGAIVDQAYWHLAKTYQALSITDPRARESLNELNDAYAVLGTPRLREEYDATLSSVASAPSGVSRDPVGSPNAARERRKFGSFRLPHISLPAWPFVARTATLSDPASSHVPLPFAKAKTSNRRLRAVPADHSDVRDLHASTAQMLERWRTNANIQAGPKVAGDPAPPDTTLVDIFRTERDLTAHGDPLAAVMEILKAPPEVIAAGTASSRT
jgi:hypothetical protein